MNKKRDSAKMISLIGTSLFLIMGVIYVYALHTGTARHMLYQLRHLGIIGLFVGILVLAILTIIPVPDEFVSVFLIEVYGPWLGLMCSVIGGVLGAVVASYLCKWMLRPYLEKHPVKFLNAVDKWIQKRGMLGLLVLRWIPIVPFHLLNYVCGLLKIKLWSHLDHFHRNHPLQHCIDRHVFRPSIQVLTVGNHRDFPTLNIGPNELDESSILG